MPVLCNELMIVVLWTWSLAPVVPWNMSSEMPRVLPLLWRRPMFDVVSLESPAVGFPTLKRKEENVCNLL